MQWQLESGGHLFHLQTLHQGQGEEGPHRAQLEGPLSAGPGCSQAAQRVLSTASPQSSSQLLRQAVPKLRRSLEAGALPLSGPQKRNDHPGPSLEVEPH